MKKADLAYYERFKEPLKHFLVFVPRTYINFQAYVLFGLFAFATAIYALELTNVIDSELFTIPFYAVTAVVTLVPPMLYIRAVKRRRLIVCDKAIIWNPGMGKAKIYAYEDTESAQLTDDQSALVVSTAKHRPMTLSFDDYDEALKKLTDLYRYMGFFREEAVPFTVTFTDDDIVLEKKKQEMDEETSQLFEKFIKKYKYLTPGFVEDIIFFNVEIAKVQLTEAKHMVFFLSHVDVKPNHPENTSFKAHKTDSAVAIFENVADIKVFELDDKGHKKRLVGETVHDLRQTGKAATIFEGDYQKDKDLLELVVSHGTQKRLITMRFSQVIVGWNNMVKPSWFEK